MNLTRLSLLHFPAFDTFCRSLVYGFTASYPYCKSATWSS